MITYYPLNQFLMEYTERNSDNEYRPVAVGRYGIRTRESIFSKELAKDYSKNKLIYKDTLTVGMGSVQIDIGVLSEDVIYSVSPAYHTYRIEGINSEYLKYCLECRNQDMFVRYVKKGSRQGKTIDLKRWLTYEIPVCSEMEQKRVVEKISYVDALIEVAQTQLAKLDDLVKSRFIELFGDAFEHTKLTIGDISEESTVGIANSATHAYSDSGVVLLRNQNIRVNSLDDSDLIYITEEFASNYKNKALKANDILVTRTGANVGMACIVPPKYEGCQTFTTLILRLKKNVRISPVFVCHYINSPLGKQFIDDKKVGGAQPNFGAKQLATMPIIIPVAELQSQFEMLVEHTDKSKLAVQKTLEKLETLKKSLMQQYFG